MPGEGDAGPGMVALDLEVQLHCLPHLRGGQWARRGQVGYPEILDLLLVRAGVRNDDVSSMLVDAGGEAGEGSILYPLKLVEPVGM